MQEAIKIGGASGFWGDSNEGTRQLVSSGQVDYIVMDYLAELTMSILAQRRARDPSSGFATDFISETMNELLSVISSRRLRVVTNAGGMNPRGCAQALRKLAENQGIDVKIGVVEGDELLHLAPMFRAQGLADMFDGSSIPENVTSLNTYLGAFPIAKALSLGADIVITGRCADSALVLGPLIHEFKWGRDNFDLLAAGSLAGHIIECGTQATGGLFTDWREVSGRENLGFPIVECCRDGTFELFKPENTGGLITPLVAAEQLLYEVGDPTKYLLPDVVCDLSNVHIVQVGENRVRVTGAKGYPPSPFYKTSGTFQDGYRSIATLTIIGHEAVQKAHMTAEAILARTRSLFRARNISDYQEANVEVLGSEASTFGRAASGDANREVVMRVSVRHEDPSALDIFAREIAPFGTSGAPGTTGFGGRPKQQRVYRLFSILVPKSVVHIEVDIDGKHEALEPELGYEQSRTNSSVEISTSHVTKDGYRSSYKVPLRALAVARSGDKGDTSNIAVICRHKDFFDLLLSQLTAESVRQHLSHLVKGAAERFVVPGVRGFNFVLHDALAGGGSASLRSDALGKAFAQILLEKQIEIPKKWRKRPELATEEQFARSHRSEGQARPELVFPHDPWLALY